jgi:hypothetical protein
MSPRVRSLSLTALTVAVAALSQLAAAPAVSAAAADELRELVAAFEARTGARLAFSRDELPEAGYYDAMPELTRARRLAAATIALREAGKYPPGYLGAMGLEAVGVFDALVSHDNDGHHAYDEEHGGYLFYGVWNGKDGIAGAYYTDGQLPLTLHHEIFHHVDGTVAGVTKRAHFLGDDARWVAAVDGSEPYPAPAIAAKELAALRKRGSGEVLEDAASDYASKNHGEDQAETARWMMVHLADALVQVVDQPGLAGSQRLLHLMDQFAASAKDAPDVAWFVDVALGRDAAAARGARGFAAVAQQMWLGVQRRVAPDGATLVVWGREDASGVNGTLRADIARFAEAGRAIATAARGAGGGAGGGEGIDEAWLAKELALLDLLARYHEQIAGRWSISDGTEQAFAAARTRIAKALPASAAATKKRLAALDWAGLDAAIADGGVAVKPAPAPTPVAVALENDYMKNLDSEIDDRALRATIKLVQPAAVRLDNGSGVNLHPSGLVLTAGHVVDAVGKKKTVRFPDGTSYAGEAIYYDEALDLAVVKLAGARDLPVAPIAAAAPVIGDVVVAIGQPGRYTPDGEETGYQPFHVSVGEIRGFKKDRVGDQGLGGTKHDAWTYWGHSGCPLYGASGAIVALHNSWDSKTAMRHAVTWEAIVKFLDAHSVPYTTAP